MNRACRCLLAALCCATLAGCRDKADAARAKFEAREANDLIAAWAARDLVKTSIDCTTTALSVTLPADLLQQRNQICQVDWPLTVVRSATEKSKEHPAGKPGDPMQEVDNIQHDIDCSDLFMSEALKFAYLRKPVDAGVTAAVAEYAAACPSQAAKLPKPPT